MGIDIYTRWEGQTEEEKKAQHTGFDINSGHVGYLREAYHGKPYATRYLLQESFATGEANIPAATLRERLPATIMIATYRNHLLYEGGGTKGMGLIDALAMLLQNTSDAHKGSLEDEIATGATEEQIEATKLLIEARSLPPFLLAFVDFVELCERKEAETGKPCTIICSA